MSSLDPSPDSSPSRAGSRFRRQQLERSPESYQKTRLKRWLLAATAFVAALSLVIAGGFAVKLRSNFSTAPLSLGEEDGIPSDGPLEILLLGTDTRTGQNEKYGGAEFTSGKGHSDVMMLLQISEDRKHVSVVSFPRDTLVPLPQCTDPDTGKVYPAQDLAMLNYALSYGGPGCTVAAINQLTGLNIDHFMMADFNAVKEISNAVGGVQVCLNSAVKDTYSGLDLPAGISTVKGDSALAYLRTRHGFADGGDVGRIRAQQSFMAALVRKIKSEDTLSNLPKLYAIADAMTKNLTVDEGLSNIPTLISVAKQLNDAELQDIAFVSLPTKVYEPDPNRLAVDEPRAEKLFEILRTHGDVTGRTTTASPSATPKPSASASQPSTKASTQAPAPSSPSAAPTTPEPTPEPTKTAAAVNRAWIPLDVLNALGDEKRTAELVAYLQKSGYTQTSSAGKAASEVPSTQILYSDDYADAAADLASHLNVPDAQLVRTTSLTGVRLVLGQDFRTGTKMSEKKQTVQEGLTGQTADQVTCQQANPAE